MKSFMRFLTSPLARLAVTGVCFYLLFRTVKAGKVFEHLLDVSPWWLAASAAFTGIAVTCAVVIWGLMLRGCGHALPWRRLSSFYLQGLMITHVVPGGVGGEVVRAVMTAQITGEGPAMAALAASRLVEGVGVTVFAIVATLQFHAKLGLIGDAAALVLALTLIATWVLAFKASAIVKDLPQTGPWWLTRVSQLLEHFAVAFESYRQRKSMLLAGVILGLFSWGCNMAALVCLAHAVDAAVPWAAFAVCIPLSAVAVITPSVNGMGLREGVMVGILGMLGIHASQAFALALLVDFQFLPFVLVGGLCWLFDSSARNAS